MNEAGVARSQIEASRRKLSSGESLDRIQHENSSYLNEGINGKLILAFLIFLSAYLLFGLDTYALRAILIFLGGLIILKIVFNARKIKRMKIKRQQDLEKYEG